MAIKKALVTGITGQDGSYLAELLLEKGYEVHGVVRRSSTFNTDRVEHLFKDPHETGVRFFLHYGDLLDASSLSDIVRRVRPDEVYNLAAQSHVRVSFDMPCFTTDVTATGTVRLLEAVRQEAPEARFYQASSSEMFGKVMETPQKETTPFYPRSPYGCAKLYSYWVTVNYRESYGLHTSNGILFNHESPRRGKTFVTQKISEGLARISKGRSDVLYLGNLDAKRDWGFAGDYVDAMWRMLQQEQGDDYVVAMGEMHSVREFAEDTANCLGFEIAWEGEGEKEIGINRKTGVQVIGIDSRYYRPAEVDLLLGDPSKAKRQLNWQPQVSFKDLVKMMAESAYADIR
jgi:GDPmannose 4,6-dehydratase